MNAPVVQHQSGGITHDLKGDYLVSPGDADVMFPTHFESIAKLHAAATRGKGAAARKYSTAAFMKRYAELPATRTTSGYNPLTEDFTNTSFLLTGSGEQCLAAE